MSAIDYPNKQPTIIPVILSGGAGTRLWPISRESHPKPFMALPDGESLLMKTYARAAALPHIDEIITITNKDYYYKSKAEYAGVHSHHQPIQRFILEPFAKNTAAAIALAALTVAEERGDEAILLILPADHLITPNPPFIKACQEAFTLANAGHLVTFGITPTRPETGYGYIECANDFSVQRFVEKPELEKAIEYVEAGNYFWNSGMFCFTAGQILAEMAAHAPEVLQAANTCFDASYQPNASVLYCDESSFTKIPSISIDYAVMEKSNQISIVPCKFNWQDIGSWEAYKQLFVADAEGNTVIGDAILIDSKDNLIHSHHRMVSSIGINNLAIIDTPDALLITQRDRAQDVKQIVQTLKANAHESYHTHKTVQRPWGTYTVLEEGPCFKIKRIEVKSGASLSLQLHHKRSEHWVVVEGEAHIINADKTYTLQTNESTFIPMNTPHRLSNPTDKPLIIIEVQTGNYLGEDDIIRLDDSYGRTLAI